MLALSLAMLLAGAAPNRIERVTPARTIPPNGWVVQGVPGGRVLPCDVTKVDEGKLLKQGGVGAIYPVGEYANDYHRERIPLVVVHGIRGSPGDLQPVVDRVRRLAAYQVHAFAYESWRRRTTLSGQDLAAELRALAKALGPGRELVIVAHSMGGLVSRWALDQLAFSRDLQRWKRVRLITADTPWHGFGGPGDRGFDKVLIDIARPFLPDALEDMRAKSSMFVGDPGKKDPLLRAGIFGPVLPETTEVDIAFADSSKDILDYTEGDLQQLAPKLAEYYKTEAKVTGPQELINFWRALISGRGYFGFQDEMRALADGGKLNAAAVSAGLLKYYPRFPGDHTGVLREHPGKRSWLDHLEGLLRAK